MAQANQISIEKINPERGVPTGRSVLVRAAVYHIRPAKHGVQVWYEHNGDRGSCQCFAECIQLLWDYPSELGITIAKAADTTEMAEERFEKVKAIA
jgi:hypothetical protein